MTFRQENRDKVLRLINFRNYRLPIFSPTHIAPIKKAGITPADNQRGGFLLAVSRGILTET